MNKANFDKIKHNLGYNQVIWDETLNGKTISDVYTETLEILAMMKKGNNYYIYYNDNGTHFAKTDLNFNIIDSFLVNSVDAHSQFDNQ